MSNIFASEESRFLGFRMNVGQPSVSVAFAVIKVLVIDFECLSFGTIKDAL